MREGLSTIWKYFWRVNLVYEVVSCHENTLYKCMFEIEVSKYVCCNFNNARGRCYGHNFQQISIVIGEKIGHFLILWSKFRKNLQYFVQKMPTFRQIFGKNSF
jgi:hypothetical protein